MTVKELIDQLSKIENQDLQVLIKGTDPTDFVYHNDIQSVKKSLMSNYDGELYEIDEDDIDEDDDEQVIEEVIILDGGLF